MKASCNCNWSGNAKSLRTPSLLLAATLLAAGCATKPPSPTSGGKSAALSAPPRFDGIYLSDAADERAGGVSRDYLRFLADGRVLGVSSSAPPETAASWLFDESDRVAKGKYELREGKLAFVLESKQGAVEYEGAIDADQLHVRWRSRINDASRDESLTFVSVTDDGPAPPPEPTTKPDPALIPRAGQWSCYRSESGWASRCAATAKECAEKRERATALAPEATIGTCTSHEKVFCHTVTETKAQKGVAICYPAKDDCLSGVRAMLTAPDAAEYTFSACAEV